MSTYTLVNTATNTTVVVGGVDKMIRPVDEYGRQELTFYDREWQEVCTVPIKHGMYVYNERGVQEYPKSW